MRYNRVAAEGAKSFWLPAKLSNPPRQACRLAGAGAASSAVDLACGGNRAASCAESATQLLANRVSLAAGIFFLLYHDWEIWGI